MFHILLHEPEIPPNTGNVMRLAANTGCTLHLVEPLGFEIDDARLRRAGLDYREFADVRVHPDLDTALAGLDGAPVFAFTTRAQRLIADCPIPAGAALLFGAETRGLPDNVLGRWPDDHLLRLPMRPGSRSLNLSNAVAVAVYEAWRQHGFAGGA